MKSQKKNIESTPKLKHVFRGSRIVGLAGNRNTGKTNNLVALLLEMRKKQPKTPVYIYGFMGATLNLLKEVGCEVVSSIDQIGTKKDCILVLDEFQRLHLNDRRFRHELVEFVNFVYHNNVYVILSSASVREFNNVVGTYVEGWAVKSIDINQCVNGSQLKRAVDKYKGTHKTLRRIDVPKDTLLLLEGETETTIQLPYIKQADTKKDNVNVW